MNMNIAGLQKVSTIDYPGEISCIIFLHGCNFRCGYCYNCDLVLNKPGEGYSEEYVLDFLKKRKGKLDAVCITGGEPLLTLDLDFVKKIRDLGYKIKMDTNGSLPEKLKELIDLKLVDYIAMDMKSDKENFCKVIGVPFDLKKIERSMKLTHDFGNSEFRTTITERYHNKDNMKNIGEWMNRTLGEKPKRLFLQGFRKSEDGMVDMDFMNEPNVQDKYLEEMKKAVESYVDKVEIRN